jgi:SAM-dependent methyltransferase
VNDGEHWERIYRGKSPPETTWYQAHLEQSLALIERCGLDPSAHIVDVGGGASTLVDDLLERGFQRVSVADLSAQALAYAKDRLGPAARQVQWLIGDVTTPLLEEQSVDLWHDRAVFHFFIHPRDRDRYVEALRRSLRPGGYVIIATFSPDGPDKCSGLPTLRYSPEEIATALGSEFELIDGAHEVHTTPRGGSQAFSYALLKRRDDAGPFRRAAVGE